jgi:D-alanine-D-alanine ligase
MKTASATQCDLKMADTKIPDLKTVDAKMRIGIVYGGQSVEHEISILSARFVLAALDRSRFEPLLFGISREGQWIKQAETALLASVDPKRVALQTGYAVNPLLLGAAIDKEIVPKNALEHHGVDVIFPVLHGSKGEDGAVQGLLEVAGIPYVGAGVLGSALGMDKDVMKRLLVEAGIPVAKFMVFRKREFERQQLSVCKQAACLGFPLFTKPANLGSSVGIRKVANLKQLRDGIAYALQFDTKVIVEEAIVGRELECAVLGGEELRASIVGEIIVTSVDGFYSYSAKYLDEHGARIEIPARIDRATTQRVQRLSIRAFEVLECYGLARVDFFLTAQGRLLVNEINTLPGFTAISMYPKLWQASGLPGRDLVTRLIELAMQRHSLRALKATSA